MKIGEVQQIDGMTVTRIDPRKVIEPIDDKCLNKFLDEYHRTLGIDRYATLWGDRPANDKEKLVAVKLLKDFIRKNDPLIESGESGSINENNEQTWLSYSRSDYYDLVMAIIENAMGDFADCECVRRSKSPHFSVGKVK